MSYNNGGYNPYQNGSYTGTPQQGYAQQPQQFVQPSYQSAPQNNPPHFGDWVDGEAAARAYQFPPNWPNEMPLTLWDINDDVFYVKAKDSFGRLVPLKKARFTWEQSMMMLPGQSGNGQSYENFATKEDLEHLKNEIIASMSSSRQQMSQQAPARNGGTRE